MRRSRSSQVGIHFQVGPDPPIGLSLFRLLRARSDASVAERSDSELPEAEQSRPDRSNSPRSDQTQRNVRRTGNFRQEQWSLTCAAG